MTQLIEMIKPMDSKMTSSQLSVFTNTAPIRSADAEDDDGDSVGEEDEEEDQDGDQYVYRCPCFFTLILYYRPTVRLRNFNHPLVLIVSGTSRTSQAGLRSSRRS